MGAALFVGGYLPVVRCRLANAHSMHGTGTTRYACIAIFYWPPPFLTHHDVYLQPWCVTRLYRACIRRIEPLLPHYRVPYRHRRLPQPVRTLPCYPVFGNMNALQILDRAIQADWI